MAKLAILSSFDQIARPLEGARTQNYDRNISYGIWGHISKPLFKKKFFYFSLHPTGQRQMLTVGRSAHFSLQ